MRGACDETKTDNPDPDLSLSLISNSRRESREQLIFAASNLPRATSNYAVSRNEIRVKVEIVCHALRSIRHSSMNIYEDLTDNLRKILRCEMFSPEKDERSNPRSTNLDIGFQRKLVMYLSVQFFDKFDNERSVEEWNFLSIGSIAIFASLRVLFHACGIKYNMTHLGK